ncbi:MAG TPA: hypothetical protein P5186_17235 [Candidatus Paceibacterota bacterium]|nr:hypothetical protein [Verrucomicrobiota bacterium]HRY49795.1 hypothetical protein [Candidatus Paceibacterota bacterium]
MNHLTKGKLLGYLAAIFVAGLIAGGVLGFNYGRQSFFKPPPPDRVSRNIMNWLKTELQLSPEQARQIEPILEETTLKINALHQETRTNTMALIRESHQRMAPFLSEAQKTKLEELGRPGPGPGPGPGDKGPDHRHPPKPPPEGHH